MATTPRHGKAQQFTIQDAGNTVRDISDGLRNISFPRSIDSAESHGFGAAAKTFVVGIPGATFSIDGIFDAVYDGYLSGLAGFDTARAFVYGPEGTTTGRVKYTGSVLMTSYNVTGSITDTVQISAEFVITGAVTRTTY